MKKILIIEDDVSLIKYVKEYLTEYDYLVQVVTNFDNVKEQVMSIAPDLVLLDINLPKFDGFYFLKSIRNVSNVPVIIVSARNSDGEQIMGMDLGADDYVTKPFSMGILLAKINAVMRRVNTEKSDVINVNDITLICSNMQLKAGGRTIELSKNEYKLLRIFMSNYNKVVPREKLLEELWDDTAFVDDNTLTVNMTRLKKILCEAGVKESIVTKRGVGYVFV